MEADKGINLLHRGRRKTLYFTILIQTQSKVFVNQLITMGPNWLPGEYNKLRG